MKRLLIRLAMAGGLCLIAAQAVRPDTTNPPVDPARSFWNDRTVDARVRGVLRRACADCHSNETAWPWYAQISPFSWLVNRHVREGREKINLSEWSSGDPDLIAEIYDSVARDKMPMWSYLLMHPGARLSAADRSLLQSWAQGKLGRQESSSAAQR